MEHKKPGSVKITLPENVKAIIGRLEAEGFEAYAVGGCVRDSVLGRTPLDWDITTSAKPAQVKKLFSRTVDTGIRHGTVTVLMGREGFEVTTYRIDGVYEDARHPKEVRFTGNLLEDLRRRDFTINAMAYNEKSGLIDAFGGLEDLERGQIRCVGNAQERFAEDALRMLRSVRFCAQLGFTVAEETQTAAGELAGNLARVSAERIQAELVRLLVSDHPEALLMAYTTGLTAVFLPEFDAMMETPQQNPHHCYSVGRHTVEALKHVGADKVLRLAMLLHDVAKPACRRTGEDGIDHFYGHPAEGSRMAEEILRRLKFDNDTTAMVCRLIRWHDDNPELKAQNIRRSVSRAGAELYPALFAIRRADILAQSSYRKEEKMAYVDAFEQMYRDIIRQRQCLAVKDLAVDGRDLIRAGMTPGKELGDTLKEMLSLVIEQPEMNRKDLLLKFAQEKGRLQTDRRTKRQRKLLS